LQSIAQSRSVQAKDSKAKDFEVRAKINLFKDPEGLAQAAAAKADKAGAMVGEDDAEDDAPEVRGMHVIPAAI
jgi:hypothetical protein